MRTVLDASVRPRLSGGALNQLRKDGFIPVSVSARAEDTQHGSVSRKQLEVILGQYGASALIEIKWPETAKKVLVIARDIQRDPITHKLIHVGFQRLLARDPITAAVRVTLVGQPKDARAGVATLDQTLTSVQVRAVPDKLPSHIEVDVSGMETGSVMHLSELPTHADYELVAPPETVVAVLQVVRGAIEKEAEPEAAEEELPA